MQDQQEIERRMDSLRRLHIRAHAALAELYDADAAELRQEMIELKTQVASARLLLTEYRQTLVDGVDWSQGGIPVPVQHKLDRIDRVLGAIDGEAPIQLWPQPRRGRPRKIS